VQNKRDRGALASTGNPIKLFFMQDSLLATLRPILPAWVDHEKYRLAPLGRGGSLRKYYRLSRPGESLIVMDSSALPEDFERFLSIAEKLGARGLPIPEIHAALPDKGLALLEDLGDATLYSLMREAPSRRDPIPVYKKVLTCLIATQNSRELLSVNREFGFQGIRWETDYFYQQCVRRFYGIKPENEEALLEEFDALASKVEKAPRVFMYRDFQSQNIMVRDGEVYFLDFQGARRGLPHYDLVSLVRDPYARIPRDMESVLVDFYAEGARGSGWFEEDSFREYYLLAGIQRHAQALGAFAYLALTLKKLHFLDHVRPCLEYLLMELRERGNFPCFRDLVEEVMEAENKRGR